MMTHKLQAQPIPKAQPMLKVQNLHSYYGRAHILHGVSFEMNKGEIVAMVGRNGAGKSTTMKSVMGLVPPARGSVILNGQEIAGREPFEIARQGIGYVPEERRIFSDLTVMENLEVGLRPPRPNTPHWNVNALFDLFPNLGRMQDRLGGQMSGGEQQMLTIARTLMGNPQLLLLDEPSEGLAPVIIEEMAKAILRLKDQGLTVLISEQNLHFARLVASRCIILEKGIVRFDDAMELLMSDATIKDRFLAV
jgi:branched-chain amino acid transport system ATP-binding protein